MEILVTGGSGFIGSHLIKRLLEDDHVVINLDLEETPMLNNRYYKYVKGSVLDFQLLDQIIQKIDLVFHLASVVGVKNVLNNPVETAKTSIIGTEYIMSLASKYKKKVVYTSTSEVYGKNSTVPLKENDDAIFGNTTNSRWIYAHSKSISEMIALQYHKKENLQLTIIRPFNVVGPGQLPTSGMVLPVFIDKALKNEEIIIYGDGSQIRCFTHLDDVINVFIKLIKQGHFNGEVYNVGNNNQQTINNVASLIKKITNSKSNINYIPYEEAYGVGFEEVPVRVPDNSKIKNLLGDKILNKNIDIIIKDIVVFNKERGN